VLERAGAEVNRTAAVRGDSAEAHGGWQRAAREFREARAMMYPDAFWADVRRLAAGEHEAVEPALVFLETDPWCFRSGYVKEELMRLLVRHELTAGERERLEGVLLRAVDVGDRREFRRSCRLAAHNKTPRLRQELGRRLLVEDPGVSRRALLMLTTLRRARFTPSEIERAREIVLAGARTTGSKFWRVPNWVGELTRRFWSEAWGHQLATLAIADSESRHPAITILARSPAFELDASVRSTLTELLLRAVDREEDASEFLSLARMLDTPELRAQLEQRRHDPHEQIARRAWSTLNDILGPDFNPWPQEWRTDP